MRSLRSRLGQGEDSGAILVFTAILMVVLIGFAALAVDAGHAFTERRSSQSTADVAAVGAAVQTIQNDGTDSEKADEVIAEAQRLVSLNIGAVDWASCSDPDALALTWQNTKSGPSNCISWSEGFRRVRVRVPPRDIDTFFAGVIGFDTVTVGAVAEVEGLAGGLGGILPFGVLSDAGEGSLLCLKTVNGAKKIPPECEAPTSGDFGYLDFSVFGEVIPGAELDCANTGSAISRLAENIAHGVDHLLAIGPVDETDSSVVLDADKCSQPNTHVGDTVNATDAKTGTAFQNVIFPGFISGTSPPQSPEFPGRLTVTQSGKRTTTFGGVAGVDDVALWEYLIDSNVCNTAPDVSGPVNTEAEMISCMNFAVANDLGPIFTGLKDSPRFGAVPRLWKEWPPGGSANRTFRSFVTIYVQTLYAGNCTFPDGSCQTTFEPGPPSDTVKRNMGATSLDAVSAIAIPDSLVTVEDLDALQSLPEILEYLIVE